MFSKVLIANRGEIAVRIIRTCRELDAQTVAVYSEADQGALRTQLTGRAICTGPAKATDSYLNVQAVSNTVIVIDAEAIHPGFDFLSENNQSASMYEECSITFIGPEAETTDAMDNKINARQLMRKVEASVIPESDGIIDSVEEVLTIAEEIGYPVMSKAVAGGGGKGIRKVLPKEELPKYFISAQQEAKAAFDNDDMYLEKIIYPTRHIEVQILDDRCGHVIHLGGRDYSLQRDSQRVLEESPSIVISEEEHQTLDETAVRAAQAMHYGSARTIEFLMDPAGDFCFMEMNTRTQVEHPVTEMAAGTDLVKAQLETVSGELLGYTREDATMIGRVIECRTNTKNPALNFAPSSGKIQNFSLPSGGMGLRVDSATYSGYSVPPYYDSVIAKVITHGENCFNTLMKMQRALNGTVTEGIITNAEFQSDLITRDNVLMGDYDTSFLQETFLPNWESKSNHQGKNAVRALLLGKVSDPLKGAELLSLKYEE